MIVPQSAGSRYALKRRVLAQDVLPARVRLPELGQRHRHLAHTLGNALPHLGLVVELADEDDARVAVLEDLAHRRAHERRVQRDRHVAGHRDREIRDQPPRRVLRHERDVRAGGKAERVQPRRDTTGLIQGIAPGEGLEWTSTQRLRHEQRVRVLFLPLEREIEGQFLSHGRRLEPRDRPRKPVSPTLTGESATAARPGPAPVVDSTS
jgi:hypothetical protein